MENGCLEREITPFPSGSVIPGYDRESLMATQISPLVATSNSPTLSAA